MRCPLLGPTSIQKGVTFLAAILNKEQRAKIEGLSPDEQAAALRREPDGTSTLELVPLTSVRAELRIATLYSEIDHKGELRVDAAIVNTGSAAISNARIGVEVPRGWQVKVEPGSISALRVGDVANLRLRISPPGDVIVGDYELKAILLVDQTGGAVQGSEKIIRVHVTGSSGAWGSVIIGILFLAGVVSAVIWAVRTVRR